MTHAVVALVGRPNVGKSTLFNRFVGGRRAIVEAVPGITRDRQYGHASYRGFSFLVIDTGGFEPSPESSLLRQIRFQANLAVEEADLTLMIVDAREGWMPVDDEIYRILSKSGKPLLVAANKADVPKMDGHSLDFYKLGVEKIYPLSAEHDRGIERILEAADTIVSLRNEQVEKTREGTIKIAIVGKQNAGKSSLVNAFLGQNRMIVDDLPGTTRDPVDSLCRFDEKEYLLVDTAGIRRKARVSQAVETFSVVAALKTIERAELGILVIDSTEMVSEQVMRIAGYVQERGRGLIILLNKWDLVDKSQLSVRKAERIVRERLNFVDFAPILTVSAITRQRVKKVFEMIQQVHDQYTRRIKTSNLNSVIEIIVNRHPPPAKSGKQTKIYYSNQVSVSPPSFVFMTNHPDKINFSYKRYVSNQLRRYFGFEGTPLNLTCRKKSSGRDKTRKRK